jgi:hypothetical protein
VKDHFKTEELIIIIIIIIIIIKRIRWAGHVARMGEKRNECRIMVGKLEERDY